MGTPTTCSLRFPPIELYDLALFGQNNSSNYAFGQNALIQSSSSYYTNSVITGGKNQGFGLFAGAAQVTNNNIAIGALALSSPLNNGNSNVAIGMNAAAYLTSGTKNIVIGTDAFKASSGSYNVCIGANASVAAGLSQCVVIGANAQCTTDNTIVLGAKAQTNDATIVPNNSLICYGIRKKSELVALGLLTPGTWYYDDDTSAIVANVNCAA